MGRFDVSTGKFSLRDKNQVASFPEVNREALAKVISKMEERVRRSEVLTKAIAELEEHARRGDSKALAQVIFEVEEYAQRSEDEVLTKAITELKEHARRGDTEALTKLISELKKDAQKVDRRTFSFSDAYGRELKHSIKERGDLAETEGLWVKYPQGSAPEKLSLALSGWNTGWCTTDCGTAGHQLKGGDFYVYYSVDRNGKPRVPRLAIRMEGEKIAEVRGIAKEQNVDPEIAATQVLDRKLKEFGGQGELYRKRSDHMRRLTAIEAKVTRHEQLSPSDVSFLYEMDGAIEGFGYQKDPRIAEILGQRKTKGREDLAAFLAYFMEARGGKKLKPAEIDAAAREHTALIAKALEAKGISDATALATFGQIKESLRTQSLSTVASLYQLVSGSEISGKFRRALAEAYVANAHSPTRLAREVVRNVSHENEGVRNLANEVLAVSGDVINTTPLMRAFNEIERISHEEGVSHREASERWLSDLARDKELKTEYLRAHVTASDFEKLEARLPASQKKSILEAIEKKTNALLFRKLALARGVPRELLSSLTAESFDYEGFHFKPGGEKVTLGSRPDEPGRYGDEENQREVKFTKPFGAKVTQVTQLEWVLVMDEPNPSKFVNGPGAIEITLSDGRKTKVLPNNPVEQVSWNDVVTRFLPKMNKLDPNNSYRLPTEAEWEYAARAGTQTRYSHGDGEEELGQYAWTSANAGGTTHAVAELKPNRFGLYDMHGNVWEWVNDWYTGDTSKLGGVDPTGPDSGSNRVLRGGSWNYDPRGARSAFRYRNVPGYQHDGLGFRLVRTPK